VHEARLFDGAVRDFLRRFGAAFGRDRIDLDRAAAARGFEQSLNDAHVGEALLARRFRVAPFQNALRKIKKIRLKFS